MGCGSSSAMEGGGDGDFDCAAKGQSGKKVAERPEEDEVFECEMAEGQEFMASKPWLGAIAEPTNHNPNNAEKPDEQYKLEYAYGYTSNGHYSNGRQNCFYNAAGNAVYHTACIGVILDHESNTQKFFGSGEVDDSRRKKYNEKESHNDGILGLALSPDRSWAVTGQNGTVPLMFCWDAATGEKKCSMTMDKHTMGIIAMSVSEDGSCIAAVDVSNDHNVYCFNAETGDRMWMQKGDQNKILDVAHSRKPGCKDFMTVGMRHACWWDGEGDKKKSIGAGSESTMNHSCVTSGPDGTFYSGGTNGSIFVWNGRDYCKQVDAHKDGYMGAINAVGDCLYTGGKTGSVMQFQLPDVTPMKCWENFGSIIRSVDCLNGCLLVSTRNGTIFNVQAEADERKEIMHSHWDGEVWGLTMADENTVVTTGDDNQVICWDVNERKKTKGYTVSSTCNKAKKSRASSGARTHDSQQARCVVQGPEGLIVAANDGVVHVHCGEGPSKKLCEAGSWIECMSMSPCGKFLAVGAHDAKMRIYSTESWTCVGDTGIKHSAAILAMDWGCDSKWIRVNDNAYELLFWTVAEDGSIT